MTDDERARVIAEADAELAEAEQRWRDHAARMRGRHTPLIGGWMRAHGIAQPRDVYRVEMTIGWGSDDPLTVTFHRFARNAEGEMYLDEAGDAAATVEPLTVPLTSLPPVNWPPDAVESEG